MIYIKNIFKFCFVIIGTIIGAGFASGKEIFTFFNVYGINGLLGIFIANGIIALVIFFTFKIVTTNNIKTYSDFTNYLVGSKKVLSYSINNIMNIFLFLSFIVMVSGFGAYFKQEFNLSSIFGAVLIALLAFFTFFKSIDGIIKINTYLIPMLIFLVFFLGIKENIFKFNFNMPVMTTSSSWLIKSILYACYNSIALIPIIISLRNLICKKQIKYVIFFTLLFMIVLSIIIFIILSLNIYNIQNVEIPIVFIANKFGVVYKYLYGIVILIAIFTTAICDGYSLLNNISKNKKQYVTYSICLCIIAICFSNIGFSRLLDFLYPVLGYLGLFQIVILCINA